MVRDEDEVMTAFSWRTMTHRIKHRVLHQDHDGETTRAKRRFALSGIRIFITPSSVVEKS
jgi:hypothetical protein